MLRVGAAVGRASFLPSARPQGAHRCFAIKHTRRRLDERAERIEGEGNVDKELADFVRKYPTNESVLRVLDAKEEVLLVSEEGTVVAPRVPGARALQIAKEQGLDLVLMTGTPLSPQQRADGKLRVCKIMRFKPWFENRKEQLLAAKLEEEEEVLKPKEMRFSINIAEHDAEVKCRKIESHLASGYSVMCVLIFAPPIPYNAKVGEEFFSELLSKVKDDAGVCSPFRHSPKQGEIRVEIKPAGGPTKGRSVLKKDFLAGKKT